MKKCLSPLFSLATVIACFHLMGCTAHVDKHSPEDSVQRDSPQQRVNAQNMVDKASGLLDGWAGDSSVLVQAKAYLDRAATVDPALSTTHEEYARYFIMRGYRSGIDVDPEFLVESERSLAKAKELDPTAVKPYVLSGHLYRLMGRPLDAKSALTKAEAMGTDDPWLQNNWADLLLDEGKGEEAAKRYDTVVNSGTSNEKAMSSAFSGLVRYYRSKGQFSEADTTFRKIIARRPEDAWSHGNYAAFLLCDRDDYANAVSQAKEAVELMNYGVGRRTLVASLYRKWAAEIIARKREEAAASFAEAQAIDPSNPAQVVSSFCGNGPAAAAVLSATMLPKKYR